jgi:hypothetical protein
MTISTASLHAKWPLERQNPATIDDRYVGALSLCAHINANPHSHASKHPPVPLAPYLSTEALTNARLPSARPPLWSCKMRTTRPERSPDRRQKRAFASTAALHKYTAEPPVCPAAAEVADGARRS